MRSKNGFASKVHWFVCAFSRGSFFWHKIVGKGIICFVEKELLDKIPNKVIVGRFHAIKNHRGIKWKVMFSCFSYLVSVLVLAFSFEFDIFFCITGWRPGMYSKDISHAYQNRCSLFQPRNYRLLYPIMMSNFLRLLHFLGWTRHVFMLQYYIIKKCTIFVLIHYSLHS
jgi:hypothetical protein